MFSSSTQVAALGA